MADEASSVNFDILLGGKVTPAALKAIKDMEEQLKKFGASTRTINAAMSRVYKETFDGMAKESKSSFAKMAENAKKAGEAMKASIEKVKKSYEGLASLVGKGLKMAGISTAVGGILGAFGGFETVKSGIADYAKEQDRQNVLRAVLRGRGREDLFEGYMAAAEKLRTSTLLSEDFITGKLSKMAGSGKFRSGAEAGQRLTDITALGGGTEEGTAAALAAYAAAGRSGRLNPAAIAKIGAGSGFNVLAEMSRRTGIPLNEMRAALANPSTSTKAGGDPYRGVLAGAKGFELLNKVVHDLGSGPALGILTAKMQDWGGLMDQLGKGWEKFTVQIGHFWVEVFSPMISDIDKWLATIDWEKTFNGLIDKGKEFGQTLLNVYTALQTSPIATQVKKIFDDVWKAMTGGIEMYEKEPIRAWNDATKHIFDAAGRPVRSATHLERPLTPEGQAWIHNTSQVISDVLQNIIGFIKYLVDHREDILHIGEAFVAWKLVQLAADIGTVTVALVGGGAGATMGLIAALSGPLGLAVAVTAAVVAVGWGIDQLLNKEKHINRVSELKDYRSQIESRYAESRSLIEASPQGTDEEIKKYVSSLNALNKAHEEAIKSINDQIAKESSLADEAVAKKKAEDAAKKATDTHTKATDVGKTALDNFNKTVEKGTGNDLVHFNAAIDTATASLLTLAGTGMPGGGGFGLGSGYGGGGGMTVYGASVPGDQPGGPTYDWNSYHGIGAYTQNLVPGQDVAMHPAYAESHYHIKPLDFYVSDKDHLRHRWADKTGSKMFDNEDLYRGAAGLVAKNRTRALIGEAGPEMVLPLTGNLMSKMGHTVNLSFGNISFGGGGDTRNGEAFIHEFAETIAEEVKRVIGRENRRSAVV
jgi:hypothetical protein